MRAQRVLVSTVALAAALGASVGCGSTQNHVAPAPAAVAPRAVAPAGVAIEARLRTPLSSERARAGDPVVATLDQPILASDGTVLASTGARLRGTVLAVEHGEVDHIELRFESVDARGQSHPIEARLVRLGSATISRVDGEAPGSTTVSIAPSTPRKLPSDVEIGGGPPSASAAVEIPSDARMQLVLVRPFELQPPTSGTTSF